MDVAEEERPLRRFEGRVEDLVGWSEEKLVATLGEPDSRHRGCKWPPPDDALDERGNPLAGCLTVTDEGEILDLHPFGVRPQKVQLPIAYEEWRYENIEGSTWVMYMTPWGVAQSDPPLSWHSLPTALPQRRPLWRRMIGLPAGVPMVHPLSTGRYISPRVLTVRGPLAVAEAASYPVGSIF
jgi:hypothetical protein